MLHKGQCHCGAVRYTITGTIDDVVACHCRTCQRLSGAYVLATRALHRNVQIDDAADALCWYRSSQIAKRGFCRKCGSNLFYKADDSDNISILAGTIDDAAVLRLTRHIFVAEKPEYYALNDDLPKFPQAD